MICYGLPPFCFFLTQNGDAVRAEKSVPANTDFEKLYDFSKSVLIGPWTGIDGFPAGIVWWKIPPKCGLRTNWAHKTEEMCTSYCLGLCILAADIEVRLFSRCLLT